MKLHYKLYKDEIGRYVASMIEYNIVISGDTREEIEIELRNAMDGYIRAFGIELGQDDELYVLDYDLESRMRGNLI